MRAPEAGLVRNTARTQVQGSYVSCRLMDMGGGVVVIRLPAGCEVEFQKFPVSPTCCW